MSYRKILSFFTLIFFDITALIVAYLAGYILRNGVLSLFIHEVVPLLPFKIFVTRFYLLVPYILVFAYEGLYTKRFEFWEETRKLWKSNVIATAIIMIILYVTRAFVVSRAIILLVFIINFILLPLQRDLIKRLLSKLHLWTKYVLIISSEDVKIKLTKVINHHPILGYHAAAHLESRTLNAQNRHSIDAILSSKKIDSIIIEAQEIDQTKLLEIYEQAEGKVQDFFVIPAFSQLQTTGVEIEQIENILLMKFHYNLLKTESKIVKRIVDLIIAGLGSIILLPLILVISLIIKLSSPGPVFYIQNRIGKNKKLFPCYKFRTMYLDAPKRLEQHLNSSPESKKEWEMFLKITNDPRVTPFGKFLRRISFDELPQLWNVIKGEMSLVGPRPYLPYEVENIGKQMGIITKVKPGITGLWQVSGRSQLTFEERLQLDEYYVKNWSIWTDLVILVKTIRVLFKTEGAY